MSAQPKFTEKKYLTVFLFVTSLFFCWGLALTLGDVLNRHFQHVLHISRSRSGLVQLSLFGAYAVMGIPAGMFMKRFGYKKGILLGLGLYALGAFLFIPAAADASFNFFRFALFVLACGLATLETVAHPLIAVLGDQRTSDQRINFSQSFNGLGGVIGPAIGSYCILKAGQAHSNDLMAVRDLYIAIGIAISLLAIAFLFIKLPALQEEQPVTETPVPVKPLIKQKHFVFAAIAQFFNVAAQGGTWAYFINYGHDVMGMSDEQAGYFFSLSIAMLMLGRFAGTALMRFIAPYKLLAIFAGMNILMCIIVAAALGWISFVALILINFFFSIMFPTIFSLGLKNLGQYRQQASSFIVMGVVGGGLFPPLMGLIANHNVAAAYYLPIICYLVILLYGYSYKRLAAGF
ncbi:L-fucose:H+ symporter permease [Chitinophaga agrisoli]|uniref:L-fucose:H+ symporter permease n=1 Tax=Chitinophaga agrisoli TaxID=2607653 RepID=A0A5B2VSF8_9BACT|nr:L-fucose:H+ symporter permease [Chitinophaga agrisoli]KAA2242703.1 L-fucose:H+ symporter permease [Chitinophaga agrisoli]